MPTNSSRALEDDIAEVKKNLRSLTRYAIRYFEELKKKYGKGRERRTEMSSFEKSWPSRW